MWLTSWPEKGLDWSLSDKLTMLQALIKSMGDKNIKLVNVVQVMLVRWILPCQRRTCHLWEFDPAKHQTFLEFFGTTHEDIWKVLFKPGKSWPNTVEDRGHKLSCPASSVSLYMFSRCILHLYTLGKTPNISLTILLGLDEEGRADLLSGPLPEEQDGPLLMKMLVPMPYKAPKKKAKKEAKETRGRLRRKGTSDMVSEDTEAHSSSEMMRKKKKKKASPPPSREGEKEEDDLHAFGGRHI